MQFSTQFQSALPAQPAADWLQPPRRLRRRDLTVHAALLLAVVLGCVSHVSAITVHLTVVTLNVSAKADLRPLSDELRLKDLDNADIYLLQEVPGETSRSSKAIEGLLPERRMNSVFRGATELAPGRTDGLAILSRFPLRDVRVIPIPRNNLNMRSRNRLALRAIAETPGGDVLVVTTHLDTRINLPARLRQVDPIASHVVESGLPAIFGGDLNTNPHRWFFHLIPLPFSHFQSGGLERYINHRGFESVMTRWKPTHDVLFMRLDWIFVRKLDPVAADVHPLRHSDHHAVVATLSKLKRD